ncbi:MAG: tRNA lysidine(34) synthetase TilS [Nitrospirae bacterium]|nr:tRNA lysidine(34) synthetase TilS [Nitrospirota bacterium]
MPNLAETTRKTIARYRMFQPGQGVVVAVSGGPDSVAMLRVLAGLAPELGIRLTVAHFDHGFRPESASEAEFVAGLAKGLGIPCVVERSDLKERLRLAPENKQAAARRARYDFLYRVADDHGAHRIAVGHTADDQAETWLMREVRGSGMAGLASRPPVSGRVVRPLIGASRADIEAYIAEHNIPFVTDPSNLMPVYLRNRLRLEVMPILKDINPRVVEAVGQAADILREEDRFLDAYTEDLLRTVMSLAPDGVCRIELAAFSGLPLAIKRRALRLAVRRVKGDLLGLSFGHVAEAVESITTGGTGRGVDMPGGVRVERSYGHLLVYMPEKTGGGYSVPLPVPGRVVVEGAGIEVEARILGEGEAAPDDANSSVFDMDKLSGELVVRNKVPGDFFCPVGMEGKKKLKEFFIDMKLPRLVRERTPILVCGDDIVWVMGMRLDRRFVAGEGTKKMVAVRFWGR